ncbi:hypothetical protein [Streptosporangium sp. KLBMP 9127]|nr:hypothetical protein [Streptosporangium sp. KLBMP 9127]
MLGKPLLRVTFGAVTAALLVAAPVHADAPEPRKNSPLIGNTVIFNDEIVEPVSVPVVTCGTATPVLGRAKTVCKEGASVSDDDA